MNRPAIHSPATAILVAALTWGFLWPCSDAAGVLCGQIRSRAEADRYIERKSRLDEHFTEERLVSTLEFAERYLVKPLSRKILNSKSTRELASIAQDLAIIIGLQEYRLEEFAKSNSGARKTIERVLLGGENEVCEQGLKNLKIFMRQRLTKEERLALLGEDFLWFGKITPFLEAQYFQEQNMWQANGFSRVVSAHDSLIDAIFGLRFEATEKRIAAAAAGKDSAPELYIGEGLADHGLQTSYAEFESIRRSCGIVAGQTIVDVGSAYSRMSLYFALRHPQINSHSLEYIGERVNEGRRVALCKEVKSK